MYKIIGADGKEYGPITVEQMRQWIAEGRANGQTKVLPEGQTEWKTVADFPELAALLSGAPAPSAAGLSQGGIPGQSPKMNTLAVIGLISGILSLTLGCCCYGLPFNITGIVVSVIALFQIKQDPLNQTGKGLAIAGLILSILSILLVGILLVLGIALNGSEWLHKLQNR